MKTMNPMPSKEKALHKDGTARPEKDQVAAPNGHCDRGDIEHHYEHDYTSLYNHALSIVRSPEVAEDVVQEAYTRTMAMIQRGTEIDQLSAWLNRCVRNIALTQSKKNVPLPLKDDLDLVDESSTSDLAQTRQRFKKVWSAAKRLSPDQKSAFILAEVRGLNYSEIASAQDRRLESVRQLLFRARQNIRSAVGPDSFVSVPLMRVDRVQTWVRETSRALRDQVFTKLNSADPSITGFLQRTAEAIYQPATSLMVAAVMVVALNAAEPVIGTDPSSGTPASTPPAFVAPGTSDSTAPQKKGGNTSLPSERPANNRSGPLSPITEGNTSDGLIPGGPPDADGRRGQRPTNGARSPRPGTPDGPGLDGEQPPAGGSGIRHPATLSSGDTDSGKSFATTVGGNSLRISNPVSTISNRNNDNSQKTGKGRDSDDSTNTGGEDSSFDNGSGSDSGSGSKDSSNNSIGKSSGIGFSGK